GRSAARGRGNARRPPVGLGPSRGAPRGTAVGRLRGDADVIGGFQRRGGPGTDQCLVVGEQDADHPAAPLAANGSRAITSKPPSARGPAVTSPPSAAARSAIPVRPWPPPAGRAAAFAAAGRGGGPASAFPSPQPPSSATRIASAPGS